MDDLYFSHVTTDQVDSWEDGLYQAAHEAYSRKVITALYLKDVVDMVIEEEGKLVLNDDTVLWHATPSEQVRKNYVGYIGVKQPFMYYGKPIKHAFVFGAQTYKDHLSMLKWITQFVMDASVNKKLYQEIPMEDYFETKRQEA